MTELNRIAPKPARQITERSKSSPRSSGEAKINAWARQFDVKLIDLNRRQDAFLTSFAEQKREA